MGLHTFVDPRLGGGRQSACAHEDLNELVTLAGKEWIFYKPYAVDVAFLRGTTADEDGNVTMERKAVFGEMFSMAQATRRSGGIVIVQVARLAERGALSSRQVKIPGMLVDLVVVDPGQRQTYLMDYSPAYAGELRVPLSEITPLPLDPRKVIARRAALELAPDVSTGIANIAAEEGILDRIVLTNEQELIGGTPSADAGAAVNYTSIVDQPYQFDFYDGGGLDLAFLLFAQVDAQGSVNVSQIRFSGNEGGAFASGNGTQRLPRRVGRARALDLLLTGRVIDAAEALSYGLVEYVFPDGKRSKKRSISPKGSPRSRVRPPPPPSAASTWACARVSASAWLWSRTCASEPTAAQTLPKAGRLSWRSAGRDST